MTTDRLRTARQRAGALQVKTFRLLTDEQARAVVAAPRTQGGNKRLAKMFGVSIHVINTCRTGRTFKWIERNKPIWKPNLK